MLGIPIYINPVLLIVVFPIYYILSAFLLMKMAQMMGIKNPWMAWVPILNIYLITKIGDQPAWWTIPCLIPYVNIPVFVFLWARACLRTLKDAGRPTWWVILLFLPIIQFVFLGILTAGAKPVVREEKLGNFCPRCGAEIKKEALFCPKCGAKIAKKKKILKIFCPRCGTQAEVSAKFCPSCGEALPEMEIEEEKPIKNFCPQCGAKLLPGANFCPKCGAKISEVGARVKEAKPEVFPKRVLPQEPEPAAKKPSRGRKILMMLLWRVIIPFIVIFVLYLIFYLISGVSF